MGINTSMCFLVTKKMFMQHPITESPPLIKYYQENKEDLGTVCISIMMSGISFLGKGHNYYRISEERSWSEQDGERP